MGMITFDMQGIEQFIRDYDSAYYGGDFVRLKSLKKINAMLFLHTFPST
jgi:hypothetical protein